MSTVPISNDQNKRAMDALERRFALAKAEMQPRERRNNRRHTDPTSSLPSMAAISAKSAAPKRDSEPDDPIYAPISQPVHGNLIASSDLGLKGKSEVEKVVHELLQSGDSAQKYIQGSRSSKMNNYILLDDFVPPSSKSASSQAFLRSRSKRSRKRMSMRQLKKLGSFNLPDGFRKFNAFMPMHDMWRGYLVKLLSNVGKNQVAKCLMDADLHGAILRVVACRVDALVGVVGIMIRETAETFGIVTQEDEFRVVVKKGSVFALQADCWKVTLHGDKLASRNLSS